MVSRDLCKVSIRRNEIIADLFFRMQKVERIGMGIQKMRDLMVAAGLKAPIFEPNGFFRAIFHRSPEFALKNGRLTSEKEFGESSEKVRRKSCRF